jgi:hypothetical protein
LTTVLYALGTVISLVGTGFLIGVRLGLFYLFSLRERALKILDTQRKQFAKQLKLVSLSPRPRLNPCFTILPDVQARPRCRDDRIPGYDHNDLHLSLCDR